MFTGIVQGLGEITALEPKASELRLTISPRFEMKNIIDGESVAVDGVCLSVERHDSLSFSVYASRQTLAHTNLGTLKTGALVNLERALAFGERLGGHLMSGHADCVALVKSVEKRSESLKITVTFPPSYSDQIIDRGSVALDGVSLTVTSCGKGFLSVNVIPDSQKRTNIRFWRTGTELNMETDMIGKYVASFARAWLDGKNKPGKALSGVTKEFLGRHGFL